jgi:GNAT superfamily N-acetyltransferase
VPRWSDSQVWEALGANRWNPPSSQRVVAENYELAVTPGSWTLTWIYGFSAKDTAHAEHLLDEIRQKVEAIGGTGARIWVTPQSRPEGLAGILERRGFKPTSQVEVLACDLRDEQGAPRPPEFRPAPEFAIREITTEKELDSYQALVATIFGDPGPSPEIRASFVASFLKTVRESGHSNQYLAFDGEQAVGIGGLTGIGGAAILWGAGVLESHRGRGIYGQLVASRCRSALERGMETAIVVARTGTSGPILKRHGFRTVGPLATYEVQWAGAGTDARVSH